MRFARYTGEHTLSALVSRLCRISGPGAETLTRAAEKVLLRANPQLRDLATVHKGVLIVVPEVPGVEFTAETASATTSSGELLTEVLEALVSAREVLRESFDYQEEEANNERKLLKFEGVRILAEKVPEVQPRLSKIDKAAKERIKNAKQLRGSYEQLLEQLDKDLSDFVLRFS